MCQLLFMVRVTGLEPVRRETHAPQTCLSANSSTLAYFNKIRYHVFIILRFGISPQCFIIIAEIRRIVKRFFDFFT